MKRHSLFLIFAFAFFSFARAQTVPKQFNYQAVARDATGNVVANKQIGVQITLSDGNITNTYTEAHSPTTNLYGLFTLTIGGGNGFDNLAWSTGNVSIRIAIDPAGGTNYTQIGSAKLLSVPYALYAGNGGSSSSGGTYSNGGGLRLHGNKFLANVDKTSIDTTSQGLLSLIAVNGSLIDSVSPSKIGKASALVGQVLKWNGTAWSAGPDETATAGSGIKTINSLNAGDQVLAVGATGTDFTIQSVGLTHIFNIPSASASNRGLLTSIDWSTFNNKVGIVTPVKGDMIYYDGTTWKSIGIGALGQVLSVDQLGNPVWSSSGGTYQWKGAGGIAITPSNTIKVKVDKVTIDTTLLAGQQVLALVKNGIDTSFIKAGKNNTILSTNASGIVTWLDKNAIGGNSTMIGAGNILVKGIQISTKPILDSVQQIKSIATQSINILQGTQQVFAATPSGGMALASDLFSLADFSGNVGVVYVAKNIGIGLSNPKSKLHVAGGVRIDSLAGTGTRMVVVSPSGYLGTQAITTSSLLAGSDIRITGARINLDRIVDSTFSFNIPTGKNFRINGLVGTQKVLIDSSSLGVKLGIGVASALAKVHTNGSFRSDSLKGTGTRLLVARSNGVIDTLNNKSGVLTYNGTTLSWAPASGTATLPIGLANQTLRYNSTLVKWDTTSNISNDGTLVTIGKVSQKGTSVLTVNGRIRTDNVTESSDVRYKTNIQTLENSLGKVQKMRGVSYFWKSDTVKSKGDIGVIAQELEKICPELVDTDAEGYKSVRYSHLVPVLIEAIKDQQKQIETLRQEVATKDTKVQHTESRIQILESSLNSMNAQIQLLMEVMGKSEGVKACK